MWPRHYFTARFFAPRYWPGGPVTETPEPEGDGSLWGPLTRRMNIDSIRLRRLKLEEDDLIVLGVLQ